MHKFTFTSLFVVATLSVAGCAGMLSVPDQQQLVSNYHAAVDTAGQATCEYSTIQREAGINTTGLDPDLIRLLNWNVYKGTHEHWLNDFNRLSQHSDIVALQEARLHPDFRNGLEQSDLHWDLITAFTYDSAETGVLLASNTRPQTVCSLHAQEPLINIPKTALVAEYPVKGSNMTLMVANIHMINFTLGTAEYETQIRELKQILVSHTGPLIVTGDFNTWSDVRQKIITGIVAELGLAAVDYQDDHRMTVFGNTVDHVYFRGLEAIHANSEQVFTSDHNPMMVTFRLASL